MAKITFTESTGWYPQRRLENIQGADYTVAIATDFTTAGERGTARDAGDRYISIDFNKETREDIEAAARRDAALLVDYLSREIPGFDRKDSIVLNFAGNGLYTLTRDGASQEQANAYVTTLLREMKANGKMRPFSVRSGGQTGFDEAAIVAAQANDIDALVHAPYGWAMRGADNKDVYDEAAFKARFRQQAQEEKQAPAREQDDRQAEVLEEARLMRRALYLYDHSDWTSWASDDPKVFAAQKARQEEYDGIVETVAKDDPELAGRMKEVWDRVSSGHGVEDDDAKAFRQDLFMRAAEKGAVAFHKGPWTRQEAEKDRRTLYVFTDNTDRDSGRNVVSRDGQYYRRFSPQGGPDLHYPTMTSAVVRGLDNALPVSTQRWYHEGAKGVSGRWTDADAVEFEKVIAREFAFIENEWATGEYSRIMFPGEDGLFNGKISAISQERTPKLFGILKEKVDALSERIGIKIDMPKVSVSEKEVKASSVAAAPAPKRQARPDRFPAGWDRYPNGRPNVECSSKGEKEYSAFFARFNPGTMLGGVDIGGKTIENVYQFIVKASGKGLPPDERSPFRRGSGDAKTREDFLYNEGYLPLWTIWAEQHPAEMERLRELSNGKILTDQFASSGVSQARALHDILRGEGRTMKPEYAAMLNDRYYKYLVNYTKANPGVKIYNKDVIKDIHAAFVSMGRTPQRSVKDPELALEFKKEPGVTVINVNKNPELTEDPGYVYIGRSKAGQPENILGNPFTHIPNGTRAEFVVASRDEAVTRYKEYMEEQMKANPVYRAKLESLARRVEGGEHLYLGCFCAPLACHGDVLREKILQMSMGKQQQVQTVSVPAAKAEESVAVDVAYSIPEKAHSTMMKNIDMAKKLFESYSKINGSSVLIDDLKKDNVILKSIFLFPGTLLLIDGPSLYCDSRQGTFYITGQDLTDALQGKKGPRDEYSPTYSIKTDLSKEAISEICTLTEKFKHINMDLNCLSNARFSFNNGDKVLDGAVTDEVEIHGDGINFSLRQSEGNEKISVSYPGVSVLLSQYHHRRYPKIEDYAQDIPGLSVKNGRIEVAPGLLSLDATDVGILSPVQKVEIKSEIKDPVGQTVVKKPEDTDKVKKKSRPEYSPFEVAPEEAFQAYCLNDFAREHVEGIVPRHNLEQLRETGVTEIRGMINSRVPSGYDPYPATVLVDIELRMMKDDKGYPVIVVFDPADRLPDGKMPEKRTILGTFDRYARRGRFDLAALQKDQRFWAGVREKRAKREGNTFSVAAAKAEAEKKKTLR